MSTFDDWFQPEAVENPTSEFLQTQYFMQKAFNAGMERAADIAKDMECEYSSVSWNNACLDVWREIRKEIISSMADVKLARQAFNAGHAQGRQESSSEAWLGNATTAELLEELQARAEVCGYSNYKTVDLCATEVRSKAIKQDDTDE